MTDPLREVLDKYQYQYDLLDRDWYGYGVAKNILEDVLTDLRALAATPDPLREAARAVVDLSHETGYIADSSVAIAALRAALEDPCDDCGITDGEHNPEVEH